MAERSSRDNLKEIEEGVEAPVPGRRFLAVSDFVRRWAALAVIITYGLVLFCALFIFFRMGVGCEQGRVCAWDAAAANTLELVKIGIMPVITLVIGYYFGRNDR